MPQTDFFCDAEDEHSLISFILDSGGWMVASSQKSDSYEPIKSWEAYQAARFGGGGNWALENEKLFFVSFDSFYECPLDLHMIEGGHYAGTYSVTQRVGGPTIDLLMSTIYEKEGSIRVSDGFIGYYSTYQSTITGEMERTPKALIEEYKTIAKHLRSGGVTIKANTGRKYIIGPHTFPRIKSGELKMGVQGLEVPPELRA